MSPLPLSFTRKITLSRKPTRLTPFVLVNEVYINKTNTHGSVHYLKLKKSKIVETESVQRKNTKTKRPAEFFVSEISLRSQLEWRFSAVSTGDSVSWETPNQPFC